MTCKHCGSRAVQYSGTDGRYRQWTCLSCLRAFLTRIYEGTNHA